MKKSFELGMLALLAATLGGVAWWSARAGASGEEGQGNSFAVRDARVFDGEKFIERATVVVRDGRIETVAKDARIPSGIDVIDGQGKTLMPALIDAHTHVWGEAQRDALRFGVGTELEMMGTAQSLPGYRRQRDSLARTDRADVWSSGAAVTVPGGHGTEYGFPVPELKPGEDADAFVRARIDEGSDFIKLMIDDLHAYGATRRMPTLDRAQIESGIAAAKRRNRRSVAHIAAEDDALHAVNAGVDGLVHAFVDQPASAEMIAAMKSHGAFMVPTLSVIAGFQRSDVNVRLADDPRLQARLSDGQKSTLRSQFPSSFPVQPKALDNAIESVRRLHAEGVDVLAGTDAGNPGTAHGVSLHGELALLVRAGLSPAEALRAATSRPAARFGLKDRGRIAKGLRADLLLVEGDPSKAIEATRRIVGIWKNGHLQSGDAPTAGKVSGLKGSDRLISDFESGDLSTRFGSGWQAASDRFMGGKSSASTVWLANGAGGSKGALRVEGEVVTGSAPWAGAMFSPGSAQMQPVDLGTRQAIILKVRGTPGDYVIVMLHGDGQVAAVPIEVGEGWSQIRVPLSMFEGADLAQVMSFGISTSRVGRFHVDVDDVAIE